MSKVLDAIRGIRLAWPCFGLAGLLGLSGLGGLAGDSGGSCGGIGASVHGHGDGKGGLYW